MKPLPVSSKKTVLAALFGIGGLVITILGCVLLFQQQQSQSNHLASLAYLEAALGELTTFTPRKLTSDERSFQRFRDINSAVVLRFQRLKYGNDAQGVPALTSNDGSEVESLLANGELLLEGLGSLIQTRKDINQFRQYKDSLLSESKKLAQSAEANLLASEQQPLSSTQTKHVAQLTQQIQDHHYRIALAIEAFESKGKGLIAHTNALERTTQRLIKELTEGTNNSSRLPNPVLRRMYVNLAELLTQHFTNIYSLEKFTQQYTALERKHVEFSTALTSLLNSVVAISERSTSGSFLPRFIIILGLLSACLSFFFAGMWTKGEHLRDAHESLGKLTDNVSTQLAKPHLPPENSTENTQQRKKIITEKNQLIHDIHPIIDGMLYVDANEQAETTGEIAKAFNSARRSVAKRLQLIQQEILRLQHLQSPDAKALPNEEHEVEKTPSKHSKLDSAFDIKSCIDITFETQAKIEHLKRLLEHSQGSEDKQMESMMECQDHLRVRLRDLQQLVSSATSHPADNSTQNPTGNSSDDTTNESNIDLERLARLINSFQLSQAPRSPKDKSQRAQSQRKPHKRPSIETT